MINSQTNLYKSFVFRHKAGNKLQCIVVNMPKTNIVCLFYSYCTLEVEEYLLEYINNVLHRTWSKSK